MKVNRKTPSESIRDLGQRMTNNWLTTHKQIKNSQDFSQKLEAAMNKDVR